MSVSCRDKDGANGPGWWEQISCLMGSWCPPPPSCSRGREQGLTLLSDTPKKGKQEMWKLKTEGFGGEEPPARADNFQRQQKTCPSCVSLSLAQAVPEECGGLICSIVAPGAAPRGGGGVHGAGEYMGVRAFSLPGSPRHLRDG